MVIKHVIITLSLTISISAHSTHQAHFTDGLEKTDVPKIFYPNSVSIRDTVHYNSSFDDKGKTLVYTRKDHDNRSVASFQLFNEGVFTKPQSIPVDNKFSYGDPHISADGQRVIMSSNRPDNLSSTEGQSSHLWQFTRNGNRWSNAQKISLNMDYVGGFGYPSLTKSNNLYFQYFSAENRNMDIFYAEFKDGNYLKPIKLPEHVSGQEFDGDPFIDRQERFLIFAGFNRKENYGLSDLYITFKRGNLWSNPMNLGAKINSHGYDGSPYVTPDDKYLIFTSSRHPEKAKEQEKFNVFYVNFDLDKYESAATFNN